MNFYFAKSLTKLLDFAKLQSIDQRKEKKKEISWPIAQYNNEIEHTIGLSEYDGIWKMLNINY